MPTAFQQQLAQAAQTLSGSDPVLADVIRRVGSCTLRPHNDYYRELVDSIISQQLSVKAAATIVNRFAELGKNGFPAPAEVEKFSVETLKAVGLSTAKANYVKDLAAHISDGQLDIERLPALPNEEIVVELTDIKGIGEWTAHMFLIFSLGRLDVLPVGDLGVRKGIMALYDFKELPKPEQIIDLSRRNRWTGYESVASWYIWKSLDMTQPFEQS